MLNLIWTDLASFITVGTKSGFESDQESNLARRDGKSAELGKRHVYPIVRTVVYSDIRYAIPAFIVGGLFVFGIIPAILMCCFRAVSWRSLNHFMNQTSMGRAMTQVKEPTATSVNAKTKDWADTAGKMILTVPGVSDAPRDQTDTQRVRLIHGRHDSAAGSDSQGLELPTVRRYGSSIYSSAPQNAYEDDHGENSMRHQSDGEIVPDPYLSPTQISPVFR